MKPFNLERAKAGDPVQTRDGNKVRLVCFDYKHEFPIIGLITKFDGSEELVTWNNKGAYRAYKEDVLDLFMAPRTKNIYFVVYSENHFGNYPISHGYNTEKEAAEMTRSCGKVYSIEIEV